MREIVAHDESFFIHAINPAANLHGRSDDGLALIAWLIKEISSFVGSRMAVIIADHVLWVGKNGTAAPAIFKIIAAKQPGRIIHVHTKRISQAADFVPDSGRKC